MKKQDRHLLKTSWFFIGLLALEFSYLAQAAKAQDLYFGDPDNFEFQSQDNFSEVHIHKDKYPKFGFGILLTPYYPKLATTPASEALRQRMFGGQENFFTQRPLLFSGQMEWYPWQSYGLLGTYLSAGYWSLQAPSRLCLQNGQPIACNSTTVFQSIKGDDTQTLSIVPVGLGVIYQWDVLRRQFQWPLVFGLQLGTEYNLWWASLGESLAQVPSGKPAKGGLWTISGQIGLGIALDRLTLTNTDKNRYGSVGLQQTSYFWIAYRLKQAIQRALPAGVHDLDLGDLNMASIGLVVHFS